MSEDDGAPPVESPGDTPDDGPGGGDEVPIITPKDPDMYLPIFVMTGVFGAIFILAPLLVRKGPNKGLIRCCILIATFSLWILWFTVYVAQMNPLIGPRLKNTTLAWIAHSWGKSAIEPPPADAGGDSGGGGPDPPPPQNDDGGED